MSMLANIIWAQKQSHESTGTSHIIITVVGFCTWLFLGLWLRYFSCSYLGHFKHFGHHHNSTRILLPNHQPKVINSSLSWPWNHGKIYKSEYFHIRCNIVYYLVYEENIWEDFTEQYEEIYFFRMEQCDYFGWKYYDSCKLY